MCLPKPFGGPNLTSRQRLPVHGGGQILLTQGKTYEAFANGTSLQCTSDHCSPEEHDVASQNLLWRK